MRTILENWLNDQLGMIVDFDEIGHTLKDGMLFIRILKYYDAINVSSIKNVFPSADEGVCRNNLTRLKIWFKLLNIDFTDRVINEIMKGNSSLCIDILYQLFLVFVKGDLHLVTKQRERSVLGESHKLFEVSRSDPYPPGCGKSVSYSPGDRLSKNRKVIEWYKGKHDRVPRLGRRSIMIPPDVVSSEGTLRSKKNSMVSERKKVSAHPVYLRDKSSFKEDRDYVRLQCELKVLNAGDDAACSGAALNKTSCCRSATRLSITGDYTQSGFLPPIPFSEPELPPHVQRYMKDLKLNTGFYCKHPTERSYGSVVIKEVWDAIVEKEKTHLRDIIASRLMKQSLHEKDMTSTLACIIAHNENQKQVFIDLRQYLLEVKNSVPSVAKRNEVDSEDLSEGGCGGDNERDYETGGVGNGNEDTALTGSRRISSYLHGTRQRYIYNDTAAYCRNEKSRTVELHRRLYAEKLKLRFERHYAICLHTIEDLIDLAIRRSEFKKEYGFEVPPFLWYDWKCLFQHEQPIFDIVNDLSEMLFPDNPNNFSVVCERMRQDILNEDNLERYLNVTDFWETDYDSQYGTDAENEHVKHTKDYESQILIGYVVHRILDTKYPPSPQPMPADIPKYPIRAVLNEICDMDALDAFRNLLWKADVLLIDVNTAVNYCLQCYKVHQGEDFFIYPHEAEIEIQVDGSLDEIQAQEEKLESRSKTEFTQTTSSLFEITDTSCMEDASKIGRLLFGIMLSGNELPCSLLVDAVVEYIKLYKNRIKGWVLVNFPSTLYQASVAEYALTSKKFPFNLEDDTVSSSGSECKLSSIHNAPSSTESCIDVEVRSSNIVTNPRIFNGVDTFKTYFSMYISTVKGTERRESVNMEQEDDGHHSSNLLLEQPERLGVPTLHHFYQEQGVRYNFVYDTFDSSTLRQLARTVLFNYFEDGTLQTFPEDMYSKDVIYDFGSTIKMKSYGSDPSSHESGSLKTAKLLVSSSASPPFLDEQELASSQGEDVIGSYKLDEVVRKFTDYPILDKVAFALASYWEAVETSYVYGFKEVFFVKRIARYSVIPYISSVAKWLDALMNKEDDRQSIVSEFLNAYNDIHEVLRSDFEVKAELHLRVIELKDQLEQLCAKRRDEGERVRQTIIRQNWTYQIMTVYANLFIQSLQNEVDLFVRTTNFLLDYYQAMLGNYNTQPLPNVSIPKIDIRLSKELERHLLSDGEELEEGDADEGSELTTFESLEKMFMSNNDPEEVDDPVYWIIIQRLLEYSALEDLTPPYFYLVESKAQVAYDEIVQVKSRADALIANEETAALKKYKDTTKKTNTAKSEKKSKKGKSTAESSEIQNSESKETTTTAEAEESLLKNLFEEWKSAVTNEFERLSFRLDLLKSNFKTELTDIEAVLGKIFSDFNYQLNVKFARETVCIENLCDLFQNAIEENTPVRAQLIFTGDLFYTVRYPVCVLEPQLKLPAALEEMQMEKTFTIQQLESIKDRLVFIAPKGTITQEAFITFIQDIISYSCSPENIKLVPNTWSGLQRHETEALFQRLFKNHSVVEWKDFLIYCLDLPYPLAEDIVDARLQFLRYDLRETEFISFDDYMCTTLWFERELPESPAHALRNVLAKAFVFSLFEVADNVINYSSMLLTFCRDVDPKVGFGKALSLFCGRCVIVYEEDLYLEKILTDHVSTSFKVVDEIMSTLIDDIVENAVSVDQGDLLDFKEPGVFLNLTRKDSSEDSIGTDVVLTRTMYDEFFRRHLVLRWTSWVPNVVVNSLLCVAFCALHVPDVVYFQPNVFEAMRDHLMKYSDKDVYVPKLVNCWWTKTVFEGSSKFKARSITGIITEIISERKV